MPKLVEMPSVRARVSEDEWQARVELAAAYRLVAHYGWTHLINNHISLRVPNTEEQFLINPYGFLYEQITASSLVKIDVDGNVLDDSPYPVNRAGFVIHRAIHMARKDLHAIIHTHTVAGQAVSALDCGLLPLNQSAMRYYKRIGYHEFEGVANDLDERERIVADLGDHKSRPAYRRRQYRRGFQSYVLSGEELRDADDGARLQPALQPAERGVVREVGADFLGQRAGARPRLAGADEARRPDRSVVPQLRYMLARTLSSPAPAGDPVITARGAGHAVTSSDRSVHTGCPLARA